MTTTNSPIILRRATPKDVSTISKLGAHVFSVTFGHSVTPEQLKDYLEEAYSVKAVSTDLSDPNKDILLAADGDDNVLGFSFLTKGSSEPCIEHLPSTIELQRLYIHPSSQGNGVGKMLMHESERKAREEGYKHIWLGVWEKNIKAQRVYAKLGYVKVGKHDFVIGGDVQTDWIFVKEL